MKILIGKNVMLLLLAALTMGLRAQNSQVPANVIHLSDELALVSEAGGVPSFTFNNQPTSASLQSPGQNEYETHYIYASALLKDENAWVYSNVYAVTVHPDYCSLAEAKLKEKLRDHIEIKMGKKVFSMYTSCAAKRVEADDWRDESIKNNRIIGGKDYKIYDPNYDFSFSYNQKDYDE